jgi:hypothetical protein
MQLLTIYKGEKNGLHTRAQSQIIMHPEKDRVGLEYPDDPGN